MSDDACTRIAYYVLPLAGNILLFLRHSRPFPRIQSSSSRSFIGNATVELMLLGESLEFFFPRDATTLLLNLYRVYLTILHLIISVNRDTPVNIVNAEWGAYVSFPSDASLLLKCWKNLVTVSRCDKEHCCQSNADQRIKREWAIEKRTRVASWRHRQHPFGAPARRVKTWRGQINPRPGYFLLSGAFVLDTASRRTACQHHPFTTNAPMQPPVRSSPSILNFFWWMVVPGDAPSHHSTPPFKARYTFFFSPL